MGFIVIISTIAWGRWCALHVYDFMRAGRGHPGAGWLGPGGRVRGKRGVEGRNGKVPGAVDEGAMMNRSAFHEVWDIDECVEEKTNKRGLLRIVPVNWPETNAV